MLPGYKLKDQNVGNTAGELYLWRGFVFYFMNTADSQSPIIFSKVHNYAMPITTFK